MNIGHSQRTQKTPPSFMSVDAAKVEEPADIKKPIDMRKVRGLDRHEPKDTIGTLAQKYRVPVYCVNIIADGLRMRGLDTAPEEISSVLEDMGLTVANESSLPKEVIS